MALSEVNVEQTLEHTVALLARTPGALDALLRGLPEEWTHANEGADTWSVSRILGHLIHCERTDWMARTKMILEFGDSRAFEPLDRTVHAHAELAEALDEFARLRSENLDELKDLRLKQEDLARRGRHPHFGVVTLAELLATWAVHDMTHLHQISRVMAYQYRDGVGPWRAYLGVLHCDGHGAP